MHNYRSWYVTTRRGKGELVNIKEMTTSDFLPMLASSSNQLMNMLDSPMDRYSSWEFFHTFSFNPPTSYKVNMIHFDHLPEDILFKSHVLHHARVLLETTYLTELPVLELISDEQPTELITSIELFCWQISRDYVDTWIQHASTWNLSQAVGKPLPDDWVFIVL